MGGRHHGERLSLRLQVRRIKTTHRQRIYSGPCAEKSPLSKVFTYLFVSIVDLFVLFLTHFFLDPFPFVFFATHFWLFEIESFS
jgi:hypothetical protein